ncbi:uncharacterized protein [Ptychodera flava]|uniref:uncharacterized protein isoform X2 n=1 Tax=Ptychodera flava TaxID=63121 RepID=UPI003969D87C
MITQGIGDRDRPIGWQTTEVMCVLNCDTQDRAKDEDIAELDEMISIVINEENTSQASQNEQKNVNRYDSTANVSQPSSVDTFDISLSSQLSQGWGQSSEVQEINVSGLQEVPVGDSLSPVLEVPRQFRFHHTQHQLEMKKSEAVSTESKKLGKVNILEDLEVSAVLSSSPLEQNEHRTGFDLHKLVKSESQRDYTCELQKVKYDGEIHEPIHFTNHHSSNTDSQIFPLLERLETHKLFSDMHSPQKDSLHAHRKSSYYSPTFARSEVSRTSPCNVEDSSQIHRLDTDNPFLTQETITGFWQPQQMVGKSKASMQEFQSKPDNLTEETDVWKFQSGGTYNPGTSMILSQLPHPSELTGMKEETSTSCIAKSLVEKASEKIEDSHWQRAVVSGTAVRNSKSSTIHPAIVETESVENGVPDNDIIDLQNQSILQEDEEMYFVDIRSVKDSYNELPSNPWRWQQASSIDDHSAGEIPLGEHILSPIQTVPAVQSSVNKSQCSSSPDVSSPLHHIVPEYASSQDTDEMDCFIIDATSNIRSDSSLNCHSSTHSSWSNKPKDPVVKQNLQPDLLICSSNDVINCRSSDTPSIRLQNTFSKVDYGKRNMFNQNTTSNMESTNMRNSLSEHTAVTGAVHHSQTDQQGGATSGVVRNRQYQFKRRERKPVISQPPEDEIRDSPQGGSSECSSSTNLSTSFNDRQNQSNALRRILARSTNQSSPGYDGRRDTRSSSPVAICSEDISSEQNAQCGTENVKNMYGNERHENQTRYQNASQDDVLCDRHDQESYTGRFSRSNQLTGRQGDTNRCKSTGGTESVGATRQYRTGLKRLSAHPVSAALSRHTLNNQNASHLSYGHKPSNAAVNRNYSKKGFNTPVLGAAQQSTLRNGERNLCGDLYFPSKKEVENEAVPVRQVTLPVSFSNVNAYKQTLIAALKEHLNIVLFDLSQRFHSGLAKADISQYIPNYESHKGKRQSGGSTANSGTPACEHGTASKMVMVKKDGPNKGRFFYTCSAPRGQQCKFFQWADVDSKSAGGVTRKAAQCVLSDAASIDSFFKSQNIALYSDCGLIRKSADNYGPLQNAPPWIKKYRNRNSENMKKKLYLQLTRKEHSSLYSKDDLWIISKDLNFDPANTFIAKSVFHGPSSSCEIEIEPVSGYSPSNWANSETVAVHAILAFNASNELSCISNIQDYLNPRVTPIVPYLVHSPEDIPSNHSTVSTQSTFRCPSSTRHDSKSIGLSWHTIEKCAEDYIQKYDLNVDQSTALRRVAKMVSGQETTVAPITLIHGVFGAGKSFLLAVTIIFLVELFNLIGYEDHNPDTNRWKILVSSTTNVAVDRILLGLLDLGLEDFVRVGSLKKIAKPVLPYSVHAAGSDSQELKGLQEMLRDDLTPSEKVYVRKSIEKHRLGHNKAKLSNVKVVGVTCAACDFPCMQKLKFPVVLLDECSQMTEPTSLLPMARFECEKLVLVGDPKQLNPTIQGSESAHQSGLEQTLFDRLTRMGHLATLLRTQYRCHPNISAVANNLFYGNQLMNGVSDDDRSPLADGFPTLCFYNVSNGKEMCGRDGSYFNDAEAEFVVFLIETLISYGVQPCNIGVITLYKAQLSRISLQIQASNISSQSELRSIQISTVDAFQGGEKGIIILSCVRTDYMGFIDCDKRTNVALTRSKNHLFIVGNMKMLYQNDLWGKVISHCQEYRDGIQSSQSFMRKWRERQVEMENQLSHESEQSKTKTAKRRNRSRKANVCDDDSESKTGTAEEEDSLPMSFDDSDLEDFDMVGLQSAKTKDRQLQRCSQQFKNAANENDALNDDPSPLNFDPDIHQCDDASAISGFNRNAAERSEIIDTDKNEAVIDSDSPSYSPLEDIQSDDSDEELPDFDVKG